MSKSRPSLKSNGSNSIRQSDMGTVFSSLMAHAMPTAFLPNTRATGIGI